MLMGKGGLGGILRHLRRAAALGDGADRTDGELLESYLGRRDEAAFEVLLRRHGPMVLGVCRRVLGNEADAHDAFQATFLVFVRKAASILPRARVGNWLYGVAHRTALKARALNQLRRFKESQVFAPEAEPVEGALQEVLAQLDDEVSRLPAKYRAAIVLCHLRELTLQEAARQLGCPPGTVASRLARARVMLARRLADAGVSVAGGVLATALAQGAAPVPPALLGATTQAAAPGIIGAAVSPQVARLTHVVLKSLALAHIKVVGAALLAVALAGGGALLVSHAVRPGDRTAPHEAGETAAASSARDSTDREALEGTWVAVSGRRSDREMSPETLQTWGRLIFAGETFAREGAEPRRGTYTLEPTRTPREIDLNTDGVVWKGIYEVKEGMLKLALRVGDERPREFTSRDVQLIVLRKER
jgi:RNA polymerase sigma-70 factor (ECF subfamily)